MKVQFMLEFNSEIVDEEKFRSLKVVETYHDPEFCGRGYDIIEVEVDDLSEIKVESGYGQTYVAEKAEEFKDGAETKLFVSLWDPVEDEDL